MKKPCPFLNKKFLHEEPTMQDLLKKSANFATSYLQDLKKRNVMPSAESIEGLSALKIPLPASSTSPHGVLEQLHTLASPATVGSAGGRYFGFVTGGSLPIALAANWLAGAWDQNAFSQISSPAAATLEEIALQWLLDLLGLPAGCGGAFVTGATVANFTALAAARHALLEQVGWDVEAQGLFGAPPIEVIVGEEAHPTLLKALGMLGLGRERVTTVATDSQGRMRPEKIPPLQGPTLLCIQAGNVNTGAFDPAHQICELAQARDAWVHIDGAFGLWAAATPHYEHLTEGMVKADSWATDAHKWLNVPYDSGLAFVKNPEALRQTMSLRAAYLPQGEHREPFQFTPEASRRARGVEIWATLRTLGRSGVAEMIDRTCAYASHFAQTLENAGYAILNEVCLNQVLVSFGDATTTQRVVEAIQQEGTCWCGSTIWQGQTAMRISVASWATTEEDVEQSLEAMLRIAKECTAS